MKYISWCLAAVLLAAGLTACASQGTGIPPQAPQSSISATQSSYRSLTPQEAKELLDAGDAVLVDVRTREEYEQSHIPEAIWIDNASIQDAPPEALPDLEAEILLYCRSGVRSKQAAEKLVAMGYRNVFDIGGIQDWPFEIVDGTEENTDDEATDGSPLSSAENLENKVSDKINPGCRSTLPYPLKMSGTSTAVSFADWDAADIDGNPVDETLLASSRLTLVSAWSSYCGTCAEDLKTLQALYEQYSRQDLNVVGIVASAQDSNGDISEHEIAIVRELTEMAGAEFIQLLPSDDLIQIRLQYLKMLPETFLLDSQGNPVGEAWYGPLDLQELQETIDSTLSAPADEKTQEGSQP